MDRDLPFPEEDDASAASPTDENKMILKKVRIKKERRRSRLHDLHCYVAEASVVAISSSASSIGRRLSKSSRQPHPEEVSPKIAKQTTHVALPVASYLAKLASQASAIPSDLGGLVLVAAVDLAEAIGRPPLRFTRNSVDQATLLKLFWAVNLFALFSALSLGFFVWAFVSGAEETEAIMSPHTDAAPSASIWKLSLMLIIAFLSGTMLNATQVMPHALVRGL